MRNLLLYIWVFSASCSNLDDAQSLEEDNAKWHFYCFASSLSAKASGNIEVNPLACDIKKGTEVSIGQDTLNIFYRTYYKDTSNLCTFMPYDLVGVQVVRNKIYLPLYHAVVFDSLANDSATFAYMAKQEQLLLNKIKESGGNVNSWLSTQAQKRKKDR